MIVNAGDIVYIEKYNDIKSRLENLLVELNLIDNTIPKTIDWDNNDNFISGQGQINLINDTLKNALPIINKKLKIEIPNINRLLINQYAPNTAGKKDLIGLSIDKNDDYHFTVRNGIYKVNGKTFELKKDITKNITTWSLDKETIQTIYDVNYTAPTNLTSNNSQNVVVSCNELGNNTYKLFNNNTWIRFYRWLLTDTATPIIVNFRIDKVIKVTEYKIRSDNRSYPEAPTHWTLQGSNDNSNWTIVDTRANIDFKLNETKTFTVQNPQGFRYYRIVFTRNKKPSSGDGMELKWFTFSGYTSSEYLTGNGSVDNFNTRAVYKGSQLEANKTYNIFLIQGKSKEITPIISLNTSPNLPEGYTEYVKIGTLSSTSDKLINNVTYFYAEQVGEDIKSEHLNNIEEVLKIYETRLSTYTRNITIFEKFEAGTFTFTAPSNGSYKIYFSGAGGGGGGGSWKSRWKTSGGGGGSGSGFVGTIYLYKGEYTFILGKGGAGGSARGKSGTRGSAGTSSYFKKDTTTYITCNAGGGGSGSYKKSRWQGDQGAGGTLSIGTNLKILSTNISSKGNGGKTYCSTGALSVIDSTKNYGRGGDAPQKQNGKSGYPAYVKIIYLKPYDL